MIVIKDTFTWQFWLGLILGHLFLTRVIALVRSKTAAIA